jgi:hypothetical protein
MWTFFFENVQAAQIKKQDSVDYKNTTHRGVQEQ